MDINELRKMTKNSFISIQEKEEIEYLKPGNNRKFTEILLQNKENINDEFYKAAKAGRNSITCSLFLGSMFVYKRAEALQKYYLKKGFIIDNINIANDYYNFRISW